MVCSASELRNSSNPLLRRLQRQVDNQNIKIEAENIKRRKNALESEKLFQKRKMKERKEELKLVKKVGNTKLNLYSKRSFR